MAEIFGAAASGAGLLSLAIQLGDCAVKLKSFYEEVEKAPKSLNWLSREIKTLALLLKQIDGARFENDLVDTDVLAQSIELCTECTEEIVEATNKLESIMRKYRAAGRVYSAFRLRDVTDLCANLERAKSSLVLAFQVFDHRSQVTLLSASRDLAMQHSLLLLKHSEALADVKADTTALKEMALSDSKKSGAQIGPSEFVGRKTSAVRSHFEFVEASSSGCSSIALVGQRSRTSNRQRTLCRFRLPRWFSLIVWEMSVLHSQGRWDLCLQSVNMRPHDSPIMDYFVLGNIAGVKRIFEEGLASPSDVFGNGSPLQVISRLTKRL